MLGAGMVGLLAVPALLLSGTAQAREDLPRALATLTPQDFAARAEVVDDPAEPHVVASTRKAWPRGYGRSPSGGVEIGDVHLRALVDRESGAVRWQLWQELTHVGAPSALTGLGFHDGTEPVEAALARAERRPERCPAQDALHTSCTVRVHYMFDLPAEAMTRVAESYAPGSRTPLRLAFSDAAGRTHEVALAPAEVAGLAAVVGSLRPVTESTRSTR